MSTVTVGKNGRVYQRKFDHDEAKRLRADGWTLARIAAYFSVSEQAVARVTNEQVRERMHLQSVKWTRENARALCKGGCGRFVWTHGTRARSGYCPECHGRRKATSVRDGALRCGNCKEWKRDDEFPKNRRTKSRRGRHTICRGCQAKVRQDYRERHKIPCVRCGQPCLPASEKRRTDRVTTPTELCRPCYTDDLRAGVVAGMGPNREAA